MTAIQFEWAIYIGMLAGCFITGVMLMVQEDGRFL